MKKKEKKKRKFENLIFSIEILGISRDRSIQTLDTETGNVVRTIEASHE